MRRALLGLAALALEGLQEDGLLAEHVRALDRPDRDLDRDAGAEDVVAREVRPEHPLERGLERPGSPRSRRLGPR